MKKINLFLFLSLSFLSYGKRRRKWRIKSPVHVIQKAWNDDKTLPLLLVVPSAFIAGYGHNVIKQNPKTCVMPLAFEGVALTLGMKGMKARDIKTVALVGGLSLGAGYLISSLQEAEISRDHA